MNLKWLALIPFIVLTIALAAPPAYKVETIGACSNAEVADAVKSMLQPEGFRVVGDSGPICEVWLRKVLPMKSGSATPEYNTLNTGDFAGVIIYLKGMSDYKGQGIKAGTYTMRYQTMPADGNHMGVSPTQEYFLLAPASTDKIPGVPIEYEPLVDLSRKASGTNHPTPLYLVPPTSGGQTSFRDAGNGHWALEIKTKGQPASGPEIDFPLALILIGKGEG